MQGVAGRLARFGGRTRRTRRVLQLAPTDHAEQKHERTITWNKAKVGASNETKRVQAERISGQLPTQKSHELQVDQQGSQIGLRQARRSDGSNLRVGDSELERAGQEPEETALRRWHLCRERQNTTQRGQSRWTLEDFRARFARIQYANHNKSNSGWTQQRQRLLRQQSTCTRHDSKHRLRIAESNCHC